MYGEDLAAPPKQILEIQRKERILSVETAQGGMATYDLAASRVLLDSRAGETRVRELEDRERAGVEGRMSSLLGRSLDRLTWDRELSRLADVVEADVRQEVYRLDWQAPGNGGSAQSCQWKVYVDPVTRRPVKTEFFRWNPSENDFVREETRRFEYPNEGQVGRHADELRASD